MPVAAADPAGLGLDDDPIRLRLGPIHLLDSHPLARFVEDNRAHMWMIC
jgi:hypothetical protein